MKGGTIEQEIARTQPDYLAYIPKSLTGADDCGNEHFLVFDLKPGVLAAVWTQSSFEGRPDQKIVFARSFDKGKSWESPKTVAGGKSDLKTGKDMCSWGFPLLSKSGRLYVVYNKHVGVNDVFTHTTGLMGCKFSDDGGQSWSAETIIPMPRGKWDNPDASIPRNWIVWQKPLRLADGRILTGFTCWVSPKVRRKAPLPIWWAEEAVIEFMRFENVDEDPEPSKLKISYLSTDGKALRVPIPGHEETSCAQEPSLVQLPDGRVFCVLRSATGSPCYSVSDDLGASWSDPKPLLYQDGSRAMIHPVSPCPIYQYEDGSYVLFIHNHDGHFGKWGPMDSNWHRRPIWMLKGQFKPEGKQPVWFSDPVLLMDNDGVPMNAAPGVKMSGRTDLAMYSSLTLDNGEPVLWYPERKFFLLGKRLGRAKLDSMEID